MFNCDPDPKELKISVEDLDPTVCTVDKLQ